MTIWGLISAGVHLLGFAAYKFGLSWTDEATFSLERVLFEGGRWWLVAAGISVIRAALRYHGDKERCAG